MQTKFSNKINAHLSFNGNCEEAMLFYQTCFGGKLELLRVGESPMAAQWPIALNDRVLHASLNNAELCLLGSDMGAEQGLHIGNVISLTLACATQKDIVRYFELLSRAGKITHPLHQFFDGTIGALSDKFGINWILKF